MARSENTTTARTSNQLQRRVGSGAAVLALLAVIAAAFWALAPAGGGDQDVAQDRWYLLGVEVDQGRRFALVRPVESLWSCETSEARLQHSSPEQFDIVVRRIRKDCDGDHPAVAHAPPTLRVTLPGHGPLTGQRISGPGYEGVGTGFGDPAVPHVIGLRLDVARDLIRANGLRARLPDATIRYVKDQSPPGRTSTRGGRRVVTLR